MRKLFAVVAIVAAFMLLVAGAVAPALAGAGATRPNPIFHTRATQPQLGSGNLQFHGGHVQLSTHHTYAIYWGTDFDANYQTLINGYFTNVAADSGHNTNVYYSDTPRSSTPSRHGAGRSA